MFGINALYYRDIYYGIVSILSIIVFYKYGRYARLRQSLSRRKGKSVLFNLVLLALLLSLFIGLRPIDGLYFVDMANYASEYNAFKGASFVFSWSTDNLIFDNLFFFLSSKSVSIEVLFVFMAVIYFCCMAFACSKLFPLDKMAAYLVYLGAFSTFSYGTNGIKAGAAASLFIVALAFYRNRKWLWMVFFLFLSWGFHHSMIMPVTAFVICLFIKNPKVYLLLWMGCFVVAALHITYFQNLFVYIGGDWDDKIINYLGKEGGYLRKDILGGFRIDFILYSFIPILVGCISLFKKKIQSRQYVFLFDLYALTNAIWMLCMYASYTNRIAYLSWLMYPIVLVYPFLKEDFGRNKYKVFKFVAYGHLLFTLFMMYLY